MNKPPATAHRLDRAAIDDCWNRIGVRGDGSCPELKQHVHCRNCPVYSAGAAQLLDADVPDGYFADRTAHVAEAAHVEEVDDTRSVVIFRVASEWLALPTSVVIEVANLLPIHSLPHRQNGVVLGLASVRGELLVCVSLSHVVAGEPLAAAKHGSGATAYRRLLVIRREAVRLVCPVDEVHGIHRFHPRELKGVPTTVAKATVTYSTALLPWQGHSVGTLDDQLLFYTLKRSLA
jgi:chemotaxis-related protein WspD